MGKRLRTLKKTVRSIGGTGRLNDAMVDKIQNYYGIAIKRNTGKDINTMKSAIRGPFSRCIPRVYILHKAAPDEIFKLTLCKCNMKTPNSCSSAVCSRWSNGLVCDVACACCHGYGYQNTK